MGTESVEASDDMGESPAIEVLQYRDPEGHFAGDDKFERSPGTACTHLYHESWRFQQKMDITGISCVHVHSGFIEIWEDLTTRHKTLFVINNRRMSTFIKNE